MSVNQIFATHGNVSLLVLTCSEGDETCVFNFKKKGGKNVWEPRVVAHKNKREEKRRNKKFASFYSSS